MCGQCFFFLKKKTQKQSPSFDLYEKRCRRPLPRGDSARCLEGSLG